MKKLKLFFAAFALLLGVSNASAGTDVTASYIGDLDRMSGNNGDPYGHAESNGIGWWNNQTTGLSGWHAFVKNGSAYESWTSSFGGAGVMMGRTMVLPEGNYTLSFQAFGSNATNSADPSTLPSAGDVVAFLSGKDNVDITNTAAAGDATFHDVSFTFDVTTANTAFEFGIKKLTDDSKIDWCQIKNVTLTLNSTNIFPVANNSVESFTYSGTQTWHTNTWSSEGQSDGTRFQVPFHELWVASGGKLDDATITGTFNPTQTGVYKVSAWVRAANESGGDVTGLKIFVGDAETDACTGSPAMGGKARLGTYTAMADGVSGTPFNYGFIIKNATINWLAFKNVVITYIGSLPDEDVNALITQAEALEAQEMDNDIKTALTTAKNNLASVKSVANYNALVSAISDAQASADTYALFAPEKTKALALGMTSEEIDALAPDVKALKVAEYSFVTTNYSYGVALGEWTSTGTNTSAATFNNEHWSGTSHDYKNQNDNNGQGWNASSWSINFSQDVALPAGNYVFKVAGRQASGDKVTTSLVVKKGEDVLGTVNDFPRSNSSRGINKSGATAFDGEDSEFANKGKGFGWEWRYVKFSLAEPATVNIAVNSVATAIHQWVSFGDYTLQTDDEDNVELMEALVALNNAKTVAASMTKNTNVGTGVFQFDETTNNSLWTAFETAKSDAEAYEFTSSSTAEVVNALATALNTAISNYQNQPLNAPDENQAYVLTNTTASGSLKVATESVTVDAGGVVFFTAVEGGYVISNPEGEYIFKTTDNNWTLSTTETKGDAYVVTVKYEGDGAYSIHGAKGYFGTDNTAAGSSVYANKAVSNNGKWTVSLLPSTVSKNITDAGWATYCSPYALDFTGSGLTAYIVTGATGNVLTLTQVTSVPANTGVLLEGAAGDYDISVVASSSTDVSENLLIGTTANKVVSAETAFVLMGSPKVGFYKNKNEFTVGANTAYLNANFAGGGEAREAYFFDGLTGINQVENGEFKSTLPVKRIVKGYLVIEKNGVSVNAAGVQVK